jgi:hypothetical protein
MLCPHSVCVGDFGHPLGGSVGVYRGPVTIPGQFCSLFARPWKVTKLPAWQCLHTLPGEFVTSGCAVRTLSVGRWLDVLDGRA